MNKTTATHKAALNIISFAGCCPSFCFFLLFPTSCWDMQHSGKRHKDAAHASSCQPVCLHFFKPRTYLQVHAVICVPHKKRTIHKLTVCHLQLYGDHMTAGCFAYRYLNSQDFFFSWSHLYLQTINSLIRKVQQIGPQSYVNLTSDWYFISHCVWLWVYVTQTITTL